MTPSTEVDLPDPLRAACIGDEPLVVHCAEMAAAAGLSVVAIATSDARVRSWTIDRGIEVLAPSDDLGQALLERGVDVLFSIANLRVLPPAVLRSVPLAVNFHDGPLPMFAGVHVTTWALIEGASDHAVTWHLMTEEIDAGEVLAEERFAVDVDETAYSLNAKCFDAAVRSFPRVVRAIASGHLRTSPQPPGARRVFGRHDRPGGTTIVQAGRSQAEVVRLVRALDLGDRTANRIGRARLVGDGQAWLVGTAAPSPSNLGRGVLQVQGDALVVGMDDGAVRLGRLTDLRGAPTTATAVAAAVGPVLVPAAGLVDALAAADTGLSRNEAAWAELLVSVEPLELTFSATAIGAGWAEVELELPGETDVELACAVAGTWAARRAGTHAAAVGVIDEACGEQLRSLSPLVQPPIVRVSPATDDRASVAEATRSALSRGPWLTDLLARIPALADAPTPLVVVESGECQSAPTGEILRVRVDAGGRTSLAHDRSVVSDDEAQRIAGQLTAMFRAALLDPDCPLGRLPICGPADLEQLEAMAAPPLTHDRSRTVWDEVRSGLVRRAEQPAISSGARTWTGADVLAATEQLMTALLSTGVKRGDRVGVAAPRGADVVIATLAVLATGAAYVPLDPAYPEDRQRGVATDAGLTALIAEPIVGARIAPFGCPVVDPGRAAPPSDEDRPPEPAGPEDLAYLMYTSGSTGQPKGVQVEHRQVVAFFAAMDRVIDHDPPGTWLAVTSLSFDISVLELLWTLSRGFHVVVAPDKSPLSTTRTTSPRPVDLSLFYFSAATAPDGYRLLLEGARFADQHGFAAVWTPERHFHEFGGPYPNPAVTGAAVAAVTTRIAVRAGSVVLPLHSPARVAEEWAVVDNLSGGRVGISVASGWQPDDFVLNPDAYADAKERMVRDLDVVRRLWRGESVELRGHHGRPVSIRTLPRPVQPELPVWMTSAGSRNTFEQAGTLGAGVLTHLLGQRPEVLAANIDAYRAAWRVAGNPGSGHVVLMVHTFVGADADRVASLVRQPLADYLQTSVSLLKDVASTFPTFAGAHGDADDLLASLAPEELDQLLEAAVERYTATSGLIGTPERLIEQAHRFTALGVDEIACLIDFGVDAEEVLASLPLLDEVRSALVASEPANAASEREEPESAATLIDRHHVTHLQCTPSQAAMLLADPCDRAALGSVRHLLVGGEALPVGLAAELRDIVPGRLTNMYGPTETTIWSLTHEVMAHPSGAVPIGRPIAGTTLAVVDEASQPVPPGTPGELVIGGDGVTRGYHDRPELTSERFTSVPGLGRAYRTGDLARVSSDGVVEFLGRNDHQIKLRGHRLELGEIETVLARHPLVGQAVVMAHGSGVDSRLVAYVTPADGTRPDEAELREHVASTLPEIMVPARALVVDAFPLTPNGKIDRKALPTPKTRDAGRVAPTQFDDENERVVAAAWSEVLEGMFGREDNFFEIGGHSLAAVKVFRRLVDVTGESLALTDMFRFPTVRSLGAYLALRSHSSAETDGTAERIATGSDRGARRRELARRRRGPA